MGLVPAAPSSLSRYSPWPGVHGMSQLAAPTNPAMLHYNRVSSHITVVFRGDTGAIYEVGDSRFQLRRSAAMHVRRKASVSKVSGVAFFGMKTCL